MFPESSTVKPARKTSPSDVVPPYTTIFAQVEATFFEGQDGKKDALMHYNKKQIDQLNDLIRCGAHSPILYSAASQRYESLNVERPRRSQLACIIIYRLVDCGELPQ